MLCVKSAMICIQIEFELDLFLFRLGRWLHSSRLVWLSATLLEFFFSRISNTSGTGYILSIVARFVVAVLVSMARSPLPWPELTYIPSHEFVRLDQHRSDLPLRSFAEKDLGQDSRSLATHIKVVLLLRDTNSWEDQRCRACP